MTQPSPFEPGRRLVLTRHGNFYDRAANGYVGRIMLVGSELTCVHQDGAYVRARNAAGEEGDLLLTSVSLDDPRHWFRVEAPVLDGYLIDGLYDDGSGGSLDTLTLDDVPALGTVVVDARAVRALRAEVGTITITMNDDTEMSGRSPKAWLVTNTLRVNLAKAAMLVLMRTERPAAR
jgi:hypothetical protein